MYVIFTTVVDLVSAFVTAPVVALTAAPTVALTMAPATAAGRVLPEQPEVWTLQSVTGAILDKGGAPSHEPTTSTQTTQKHTWAKFHRD